MAQDLRADATVGAVTFADRLADAVDRKRSQLVVGLDPRAELLPVELRGDVHVGRASAAEACARFCRGLVDAVAPYVVGVKPQLAYFEALGADGIRAFEDVCSYARHAGLVVIADGKRADIGSTARAYAEAYLEPRDGEPPIADALTVSPYLGSDSVEPFLTACRRRAGAARRGAGGGGGGCCPPPPGAPRFGTGIFCLVKTSNTGGADIQ